MQHTGNLESEKPPAKAHIATNDTFLNLPQIRVADQNGGAEIIAREDDEHGQLWDFARDKIARRMFIVRADQRTRHMESTSYPELYPVGVLPNLWRTEDI